jgi:hypothetical protein
MGGDYFEALFASIAVKVPGLYLNRLMMSRHDTCSLSVCVLDGSNSLHFDHMGGSFHGMIKLCPGQGPLRIRNAGL